ncbi:MAG: hypothetical protein ABWX82_03360 [Leifsonia sp.]
MRRFARDRLRLASVALLAVTLIATAALQSAAAVALQATLDAHWRGAYDILVTSTAAAEDGLLPPNSLAGGSKRIPLVKLDAIRALDGVEVAAPISQIVIPSLDSARVNIAAAVDEAQVTLDPQQYRLRVQYLTDDGLGARIALSDTYRLTLDTSNAPRDVVIQNDPVHGTCQIGGVEIDDCGYDPPTRPRITAYVQTESPDSTGSTMGTFDDRVVDGDVVFSLPSVALPPTRVTLIDPGAEQELLGRDGAFLDPLVTVGAGSTHSLDELVAWSGTQAGTVFTDVIAGARRQQQAALDAFASSEMYLAYVEEMAERGEDPLPIEELYGLPNYVPVIVAPESDVPLSVRIDVEALGPGQLPDLSKGYFTEPVIEDRAARGVHLGTMSADASALLDPFSTTALTLRWLDDGNAVAETGPQGYTGAYLGSVAHSTPVVPVERDGTPTLEATGYLGTTMESYWGGDPSGWILRGEGTARGAQSAYATVQSEALRQDVDGGYSMLLPIGGFDTDDVSPASDPLSYVPLGAYDPAGMTLVADASGAQIDPVELLPAAGGLGLVGAQTTAIGDIAALSTGIREPTMDAVRVRVADVGAYDRDGIARVVAVASEIEELGLAATIVAGSSTQTETLAVAGYSFGTTDPTGAQSVGALGTVEQQWSALGVAARLGTSLSQATLALLASVVASTLVLFAVASLSAGGSRRADAATLRAVGWSRRRIVRWLLAEQWPGVAVIGVAGLAASAVAGGEAMVPSIVASVLLAVVVVAVISAVTGSSAPRIRVATEHELLRERPQARPEVRWTTDAASEHTESDQDQEPDHGVRAPRGGTRLRLGAESVAGFGARLVRGDVGAALGSVAAVLIVMATTACFVLALNVGRDGAGASLLAQAGTAQALAPQLVLGLAGIASGVLLTMLVRTQTLRRRTRSRSLLRALGWTAPDIRRSERAEILVVGLPAALVGCYLLWFALDAAGLAHLETAVSTALIAGLAVVATLLVTTRKAGTAL